MDLQTAAEKVFLSLPGCRETTFTPVLIVLCGLPGSGKSYLARAITGRLDCVIVESDFVRKTLFQTPTYSPAESDFIHRISHLAIERLLLQGCRVVHDATNLAERHREQMYAIAARTQAKLVVVRAVAPEPIIRERLARRFVQRDPHDISDADWLVHEKLRAELEPVRHPHLVVDTRGDLSAGLAKILRAAR